MFSVLRGKLDWSCIIKSHRMKSLLIVILVVATSWAEPALPQSQIAIPQKCEDFLSVKACDKIKSMAENVKLKYENAKDAFKDAYQKGLRKTDEIVESCKNFYLEKIKSKKCEDFVTAETCTKLRAGADNLKIKLAEFEVLVKKALLAGKKTAIDVYNKVVEYFNNEIKGKSCEELLTKAHMNPAVCTTLRKAAGAVKVKVEKVNTIVKEALINGYKNATAIVKKGIQQIKDWAKSIKCEDMLNPGLCSKLREYSIKFKVAFPKIMETVRDLLVKGYNIVSGFLKAVYKITDAFIDCEHIFTAESCKLIKTKVTSLGLKLSAFGTAVREYATKAISKTKDIYHKVLTFSKQKWCKWFKLNCDGSSKTKRSTSVEKRGLKDYLAKYKAMLSKGIAAAKEKLKKSLEGLMDSMKIMDTTLRAVVKQAIDDGKVKYNELKKLLKDMVDVATGKSNSTTTDAAKTKRDLREQLQAALQKAHSTLKAAIEYLLTKSSEELKKMYNYVHALLKKVFGDSHTKRDLDETEMLEIMADELVKEETAKISNEATLMADELLDEAVEEVEEETGIAEISLEKRDLTSGLNKIKDFFGKVNDKVKDVFSKLRTTNIDEIKAALEKAGLKIIGVAEDMLKKIKEALEN